MFFHTGRLAIFAAAAAAIEASPWLCGGDRYCRQWPGPIRRSRRGRKPGLEIQQRGGQDPVHAKGGGQLLRQVQVSTALWDRITTTQVAEYSEGDARSGYVVESSPSPRTGIIVSYPAAPLWPGTGT